MALPPLEIRVTADTADAESGLRRVETQMGKTATRTTQYGRNAQAAAGNTANLAAQFNDIGVMLAAGQSPLLLAVQQGSQINQVMGQMGTTGASRVRALGTAFMSIVSPANLLTLGIIAGGAALVQWGMKALSAKDDAEEFGATLDEVAEKTRELNYELRRMRLGVTPEELALMEAIVRSQERVLDIQGELEGLSGRNLRSAELRLEAERSNLTELQSQLGTLQEQLRTREQINNMARPRMRPMDLGADTPTRPMMRPMDLGVPLATGGGGGGGGGGGRSRERQRERELQAFITSLQTEREILEEWRVEQLELLAEYTDKELEAIGGKNEAKLRLEQEYEDRLTQLQKGGQQTRLAALQGAMSDAANLMQSGNDKLFKIGKAFAVANAVVSGYEAATEAWAKGMAVGGPPVAAAFTAASLARTGALISSLQGTSPSGSGGGRGSGGGAGTSAQSSISTQRLDINIIGGNDREQQIARQTADGIFRIINGGVRDGRRIDPRVLNI